MKPVLYVDYTNGIYTIQKINTTNVVVVSCHDERLRFTLSFSETENLFGV